MFLVPVRASRTLIAQKVLLSNWIARFTPKTKYNCVRMVVIILVARLYHGRNEGSRESKQNPSTVTVADQFRLVWKCAEKFRLEEQYTSFQSELPL